MAGIQKFDIAAFDSLQKTLKIDQGLGDKGSLPTPEAGAHAARHPLRAAFPPFTAKPAETPKGELSQLWPGS